MITSPFSAIRKPCISTVLLIRENGGNLAEAIVSAIRSFIRATLPQAPVGSAYLTIVNHGTIDDRLVSVTSPVGREVQIHDMTISDGVMTMRKLSQGLPVPQGETVSLEPGSKHLMIMGLAAPLEKGQSLELTLHFESAGEVVIRFDILAMNARGPDAARN